MLLGTAVSDAFPETESAEKSVPVVPGNAGGGQLFEFLHVAPAQNDVIGKQGRGK